MTNRIKLEDSNPRWRYEELEDEETKEKKRRYVDSPADAPSDVEVQEGPQGGLYYEVEGEEDDDEESSANGAPGPREQQEIPVEQLQDGDLVWVDDKHNNNVVLAEVVQDGRSLSAVPVREGDGRGLSLEGIMSYNAVGRATEADAEQLMVEQFEGVGEGDEIIYEVGGERRIGTVEAAYPDRLRVVDRDESIDGYYSLEDQEEFIGINEEVSSETNYDDLEVGDEIWFRGEFSGDEAQGEIVDVYESRGETRYMVDMDNDEGVLMPVSEDGASGYTFTDHIDDTGIDPLKDDLTGQRVVFEGDEIGIVSEGDKENLIVDFVGGPNEGERIFGVQRDTIEEVTEPDLEYGLEEGWIAGPDTLENDGEIDTWTSENTYIHQNLKVYDQKSAKMRDAFINEDGKVQVQGGENPNQERFEIGDSNRFKLAAAEDFDSLDEEGKIDSLVKTVQYVKYEKIGHNTQMKVEDNLVGKGYDGTGSLINAKDWDTRMKVAKNISRVENRVKRASCGGSTETGRFYIKVSEDEDDSTISHELGHGIVTSFGYDYSDSDRSADYAPRMLSHNFTDYTDNGRWGGYIDWDLSDDSAFRSPDEYMFAHHESDGATGFESFKDDVDREIDEVYRSDELVEEEWAAQNFEPKDENVTALEALEDVEQGQIIEFNVPDWESEKDEDGMPTGKKNDYAVFDHIRPNKNTQGDYTAVFKRPNGDDWTWPILSDTGELYSDMSSINGVADPPEEEMGEPSGEPNRPSDITSNLADGWNGFNANAETPDERMENLSTAVNRAFYKQIKTHEATSRYGDRDKVTIRTGYSATNAHETMAQLHEVMQTPSDANRLRANNIADEHPYLVLAYMDVWNPSEEIMDELADFVANRGIET